MSANAGGGSGVPWSLLSPPRPPNPALERGKLLLDRRRFAMAEVELRRALRDDPESSLAHAYLALCIAEDPKRADEALETAMWATAKDPIQPAAWFAASAVYERRGEGERAEETIRIALGLNPEAPALYAALARILLHSRGRPGDALETADHGLSMGPGHVGCLQIRGAALARLGRHDEARDAFELALRNEPEEAGTHLAYGWALLRKGDAVPAARHFREALRLEPGMQPAQAGLMEALKARNPLYRLLLRGWFRYGAFPREAALAVLPIGVFVICMLGVAGYDWDLPWPLVLSLQALVAAAVVLTWTSGPLFDLLLLADPLGRHSLDGWQRAGAVAVAAVLAAAAALGIAAVAGDAGRYGFPAVLAVISTLPMVSTLRAPPGPVRRWMLAYAGAALSLVTFALVLHARGSDSFGLAFGLSMSGTMMADFVHGELLRRCRP